MRRLDRTLGYPVLECSSALGFSLLVLVASCAPAPAAPGAARAATAHNAARRQATRPPTAPTIPTWGDAGTGPAPSRMAAASAWYLARILAVRDCGDRFTHVLGVELEIDNRTDGYMWSLDSRTRLIDGDGHELSPSARVPESGCPPTDIGDARPRETWRDWLYFDPPAHPGAYLDLTLDEPHGFAEAHVKLALKGRPDPAPVPKARPRPPAVHGIAPPFESPFFRVTATDAALCSGGRPYDNGTVGVGVEVLVENFSKVLLRPAYTAILKDSRGYEYQSVIGLQPGCEPKARVVVNVKPGDKYRAWLWVIPVPRDAKGLRLLYKVGGELLGTMDQIEIPIGDVPTKVKP